MSIVRRLFGTSDRTTSEGARAAAAKPHVHGARRDAGTTASFADRAAILGAAGAHADAGRFGESLATIASALVAAPDDPELLFARASTLFAWGRLREAREGFARMVALGIDHPGLSRWLGWSHYHAGDLQEAEVWMRKAAGAEPGALDVDQGLASIFFALGRVDEAIAICERALLAHGEVPALLRCLGECRLAQNDPRAAETHFRCALGLEGEQASLWRLLGVSLQRQLRHTEAVVAFAQAERLAAARGQELDTFVDLAGEHRNAGRMREALDLFEANLALRPSVAGHRAYADALLTAGRLTEGWHHYEFRWLLEPLLSTRYGPRRPPWLGQDVRGKAVLLRFEQGIGDMIQCLRYAPYIKALGATTLAGNLDSLTPAFRGVDRVLGEPAQPAEFDYYAHLYSLPRIFGTDVDSIPAEIPYLEVDATRRQKWARRIARDGKLNVGLAWAGNPAQANNRRRSIALRALMPLLDVHGVRFYALQKGAAAAEMAALPACAAIEDLGPELADFVDTAAVIGELDLVLSVCTSVAHLGGALGKPLWLLLSTPAHWLWLEGREDTPWYPTMRLFRQRSPGDWDELVTRVKAALEARVQGQGEQPALPPPRGHAAPPRPRWPEPGHRPGLSAVTETPVGILQYLPDDAETGLALGWYGEYLQPQLDLLARLIPAGATVLEVEAGVGAHALGLATVLGPSGHLFLCESRPVVRRILRQNLAANRIGNVTLLRGAVGGPGEADLQTAPAAVRETVDELQLERLDGLKLGAGAGAQEVLDGAAATLWRLRPWLFVAATDGTQIHMLCQRAREFGYRCWRHETPRLNAANFNRRSDDRYAGRTALALLALPEEVTFDVALDGCVEIS